MVKQNIATSSRFGFAHDPKNRNEAGSAPVIEDATDTILEFHAPFRIDL